MPPLDSMSDGTIRQPGPPPEPGKEPWVSWMEQSKPPPGSTIVEVGDDGRVRVVEVGAEPAPARDDGFDENLAERQELEVALHEIAQDILEGIEADLGSREQFVSNYTKGLELLGLTVDMPGQSRGEGKTSGQKVSTVRDSTMLESIVKAQSQARGELLPASGPAKIVQTADASGGEDDLAADFEEDFNFALTKGMPEYVPDLDRGLFGLFYGGNLFRYGYHCPIKQRPRVDSVGVEDLIVSEEATSLDTATRWTMRAEVSPSEVKRKMFYGVWRDCDLGVAMPQTDQIEQKKDQISGITAQSQRPKDQPYMVYSTVTDLDLAMYGLKEPGAPKGLALPYRVTIEKYSRQVLRIERFWKKDDKRFARKRRCVHYQMVPGFGFLAYGFLHLQGNSVLTLTAVVRQLVDAMMFGNFPGGMKIKGARTEQSDINPAPGEWVDVATPGGLGLKDAVMPLPYKDVSPVSIQLYELVQQACQRVGAAASLEVGEGRSNVPVGTIMAMLEEKAVVMSAIHKRLHEAMSQELTMIRELFMERPEALEHVITSPKRQWAAVAEFADLDLVPASDPNVPSQVHRVMLATALATLAQMPMFTPRLDMDDVLKRILRMIGINDTDKVVVQPPPQQPGADPGAAQAQASIQVAQMKNAQAEQEGQRKAATTLEQSQQRERESIRQAQNDAADRQSKEKIELMDIAIERMRMEHDAAARQQEQQHAQMELAQANQHHAEDQQMQHHAMQHQAVQAEQQRAHQQQAQQPQGGEQSRSFGSKSI